MLQHYCVWLSWELIVHWKDWDDPISGLYKVEARPHREKGSLWGIHRATCCLPSIGRSWWIYIFGWLTLRSLDLTVCFSHTTSLALYAHSSPEPAMSCHTGARAKQSALSAHSHHLAYLGALHKVHQAIWICVFEDDILVINSDFFVN